MNDESILVERKDRVAIITINRPEAMNAINAQVWHELGTALEKYAEDPDLRCAIITGAGDTSFSAGADLKALSRGEQISPKDGGKWGFAGIARHYINKPIIAAVNGFALGGGTEIALSCDLIVASEKAKFGLPEVKIGVIAEAGGLLRLSRQIPLKIAMEKILTGDSFLAEEAKKWGLVNHVVPHDSLLEEALSLAKKIAENAPLSVAYSKEVVYRGLDASSEHPSPEAWKINNEYAKKLRSTRDSKEGPRAFAEKRKPMWEGR